MERLQQSGVKVIPVTAAPAGWCDQMARMWPVDGVIGENGGVFLQRHADGHGVRRWFWHAEETRAEVGAELARIGRDVCQAVPVATFADDQLFRLNSLAFRQPVEEADRAAIVAALRRGADVTVNNLWVLGWLGGYDKLAATRHVMAEIYGVDVDEERDAFLYTGDSTNDAPMFACFRHTVGVSTVRRYPQGIPVPPNWITDGPGGCFAARLSAPAPEPSQTRRVASAPG